MKICDRCFKRGDYVKAVDAIEFKRDYTIYELCESCKIELQGFIETPVTKESGSKKKNMFLR